MSEIQNNVYGQQVVENNSQNLISNKQPNLAVIQNTQTNIPLVDEPFMDPQINIQMNNPMLPNHRKDNDNDERCLSWRTFLICLGTCIGTNAVMCAISFGVFLLFGLIIVLTGGLDYTSSDPQ